MGQALAQLADRLQGGEIGHLLLDRRSFRHVHRLTFRAWADGVMTRRHRHREPTRAIDPRTGVGATEVSELRLALSTIWRVGRPCRPIARGEGNAAVRAPDHTLRPW